MEARFLFSLWSGQRIIPHLELMASHLGVSLWLWREGMFCCGAWGVRGRETREH